MKIEKRYYMRCDHSALEVPNCRCWHGIVEMVSEHEAMVKDRNELRDVLQALIHEMPAPGWDGNAPGHCHQVPGVWDNDNGKRSGTKCRLCDAYARAVAVVGPKP